MLTRPSEITPPITARPVEVPASGATLQGELDLPADAAGLVIFPLVAAGSRHSPRTRRLAGSLQSAGFGTLLLDLFTVREARAGFADSNLAANIPLLADRLQGATRWAGQSLGDHAYLLGYFASGTGASAALIDGAREHGSVKAIVAASGRPDLAGDSLSEVAAPTLLIVGARDAARYELNCEALDRLTAEKHLELFPESGDVLQDPNLLPRLSEAASAWFGWYLRPAE
jgi:dienelactone hydrolase